MKFSILAGSQYPMAILKIITLFILLFSPSMYANANEPIFSSNVEPQRHTYSMQNLSNVFLSGGMIKQPSIAEKHNFEPRTYVNVDMEKISYALDNKGMRDIKNCRVYLADDQFDFVNIKVYEALISHINLEQTKQDASILPSKDSCFEFLQFIF